MLGQLKDKNAVEQCESTVVESQKRIDYLEAELRRLQLKKGTASRHQHDDDDGEERSNTVERILDRADIEYHHSGGRVAKEQDNGDDYRNDLQTPRDSISAYQNSSTADRERMPRGGNNESVVFVNAGRQDAEHNFDYPGSGGGSVIGSGQNSLQRPSIASPPTGGMMDRMFGKFGKSKSATSTTSSSSSSILSQENEALTPFGMISFIVSSFGLLLLFWSSLLNRIL
jgi:hypothetical protein